MQYQVIIFSILLAGVSECIGGVAKEDGSSNAASINVGASSLLRPTRQAVDVTGGLASTADYPFAAFITWYWKQTRIQRNIRPRNMKVTTQTLFQCTGSLIGSKFVVTNAACFQPRINELNKTSHAVLEWTPHEAWVRCGADEGWYGASPHAQTRKVIKIIIHENYVRQTMMFNVDIALLQVEKPFVNEAHVRSPLHSGAFNDFDRMKCRVVGFGNTKPTSRSSMRPLHSYPVVMGGSQYCRYLQEKFDFTAEKEFDRFFLCGKPNSTMSGTECFGDMGAPVVCAGMVTGVLTQRRQKVPCGGKKDFSMYMMIGQTLVQRFIRRYVGGADTPFLYQLPLEEILPPIVFEMDEARTSSSTVLRSKVVVVALLAFTGLRAL